jgi:hypothetical protein
MIEKESEFGKGCVYCLGLYLAHAERWESKTDPAYESMKFNTASDHLYECSPLPQLSACLKYRITRFVEDCLEYGHGAKGFNREIPYGSFNESVKEAKDILFEIDKELGAEPIKGGCE